MDIYDFFMKPLEARILGEIRAEVVSLAHGHVLEIGIGTGANLPYYDKDKITAFSACDKERSKRLEDRAKATLSPVLHFVEGAVEALPFADSTFDSVVVSLVLCTADCGKGLAEIRRVLKPGGFFIFIEHIRPQGRLGAIVDGLNRLWPKLAKGCNLNRQTDDIIKESGFTSLTLDYKASGFICYGLAVNP